MSTQTTLDAALRANMRALKMPGMAKDYEALARDARNQGLSYEEYLMEALSAEMVSRHASTIKMRIREAKFSEIKTVDSFNFDISEGIDREEILRLSRGDWIERSEAVIFAGPMGTGKTHLGIGLGIEACKRGKRVFFIRAADMVRQLTEARDKRDLSRFSRKIQKTDLLIIDELGFVPFDRAGGELLFNIMAERYERASTMVTTNLAFSEWVTVFGDEKLTAALLDRLAHHCHVITPGGQSYRMRGHTQTIAQEETSSLSNRTHKKKLTGSEKEKEE